MNGFIFVSIVCIAQSCGFMTSMDVLTEKECVETKREFLSTKFKKEVSMAAAQCMEFKPGTQV